MINEDRVKELYYLAVYESTSEKTHKQVNEYYVGDYVWKEVLKSFFSGTFAFAGIVCLWAMNNMDVLLDRLNTFLKLRQLLWQFILHLWQFIFLQRCLSTYPDLEKAERICVGMLNI